MVVLIMNWEGCGTNPACTWRDSWNPWRHLSLNRQSLGWDLNNSHRLLLMI